MSIACRDSLLIHIDLWQVHSAEATELARSDVLETVLRIKEEGKVRHIAVSLSGLAQVLAPSNYGWVHLHHQEQPTMFTGNYGHI